MPNLGCAKFNTVQAAVVQTLDNAIHRINRYPKDHSKGNQLRYPVDRDLSGGYRYPPFEQLGPGARFLKVPVTFRARNQIFKSK